MTNRLKVIEEEDPQKRERVGGIQESSKVKVSSSGVVESSCWFKKPISGLVIK